MFCDPCLLLYPFQDKVCVSQVLLTPKTICLAPPPPPHHKCCSERIRCFGCASLTPCFHTNKVSGHDGSLTPVFITRCTLLPIYVNSGAAVHVPFFVISGFCYFVPKNELVGGLNFVFVVSFCFLVLLELYRLRKSRHQANFNRFLMILEFFQVRKCGTYTRTKPIFPK